MNRSEFDRENNGAREMDGERQYRQLFESNPHPMWIFDVETLRFMAVNDAAVFRYGFTRDEFLRMTIADIRPAEDITRLLADVHQGTIGHDEAGFWRHKKKDGTVIDVEIISHELTWSGRHAKLVLAMDVTKRRAAEARVRQMTRLYATLSQVNQTIVRAKDRDSLFRAICSIAIEFGQFRIAWIGIFDPESSRVKVEAHHLCEGVNLAGDGDIDALLSSQEFLLPLLAEKQLVVYSNLDSAAEMPAWRDAALKYNCHSAAIVPIRLRGNIIGALSLFAASQHQFVSQDEQSLLEEIGLDISFAIDRLEADAEYRRTVEAHSRLEEQLFQTRKLESIGRLAGGVAHDFNNLLGVIIGYCELIDLMHAPEEAVRDKIREIRNAATRAAELTHQLLAFSRKQVIEPKVFDVNLAVTEVSRMLTRIIGEDIELVIALCEDHARIKADRGQLEQVIMNLVLNARDAMPTGGRLTVETSCLELDETYARDHFPISPGSYVMLAVSDTGIGMSEETQKYIFEPFFTTKEPGKGTGLGLSTVYGIVHQSGGYIWVYSEIDRGTTFKIYLPRVEDAEETAIKTESRHKVDGTETILVVEDAEGIRKLAQECLSSQGYRVLTARNAREAIQVANETIGKIDLVLTDVILPDIDGPRLVMLLAPERPGIRVLYMSGYTDDVIVHQGPLDPGTAFLQKPFTIHGLWRKVRDVLDAR